METQLEKLGLSTKVYMALLRSGIRTIEELKEIPPKKLLRINRIGEGSVKEIQLKLCDFN